MYKGDEMTSNERMEAFYSGKAYDRSPIMLFIVSNAGRYAGMTHREKRSCARNQAEAQLKAYERLGQDGLVVEYGLLGIGKACGSVTNDPEDSAPAIVKHRLSDISQVRELDLSMVERKNDPWSQLNYDAASICVEKVGKEVGVFATIPGPMTAAGSLIPVEKFLRSMRKQPEEAHKLLRFCTDAAKIVIREITASGCGPFLSDPIASETLISADTYRQFVAPYTKELMDYAKSLGLGMGYHVCGEANGILCDMVDTGCGTVSFDTQVDVETAKKLVGHKVPILGNIDVIDTLLHGTVESVEAEVKNQLRKGYDSEKGFIISVSCDIPISTPLENIDMIMKAGRKYGKYPLDPENFK